MAGGIQAALDVLPSYPDELPYLPQKSAFEITQLITPPVMSEVEAGPPIVREWDTNNWTKASYRMLYTHSEFDAFYEFYKNTINRGRQRFSMPVGRLSTPTPWPKKLVFITPGSVVGPRPAGEGHVTVDFELNIQGW